LNGTRSFLFFAVGSYLTTMSCKHVTFFALSISNPTSLSASRMVCSICQSVGSTSGLTLYLAFLFFSAISFSFSQPVLFSSLLLEPISFCPFYQLLRLGGVMPFGLMLLCKLCVEQQISFSFLYPLSLLTRVSSSSYKKVYVLHPHSIPNFVFFFDSSSISQLCFSR